MKGRIPVASTEENSCIQSERFLTTGSDIPSPPQQGT